MIVCPNCEHVNPDAATQCEACYTPLPQLSLCPNCGTTVQAEAAYCGLCGHSLRGAAPGAPEPEPPVETSPPDAIPELSVETSPPGAIPEPSVETSPSGAPGGATTLQMETASFLHVQSERKIELPTHLPVIHIGKPNDRVPPDIDVSGFSDSDIASRVHADLRVEGGIYYLEDVGSANGTYINHTPLPPGNRHRLRAGDRISLGKGDKLTFIFQIASR